MLRDVAARFMVPALIALALVTGPARAAAPIEGVWRTQSLSEVTILPCPEGYCGYITKVVVPEYALRGLDRVAVEQLRIEDYVDYNNKNPGMRSRPILGLRILILRPAGRGVVYDGEIYNPEDGNTYSGYLELVGPDSVRLQGCILFNLLCRGEDWLRVSEQ